VNEENTALTTGRSVRSTSVKLTVPVTVSSAVEPVGFGCGVFDSSANALLVVSIVGVSLVPVI
jgi:hypothetical protein